jgi:hypothetical protein
MATTTKTTPTTELPALAQQLRNQLLATVQQSQRLTLDAAQNWVKAVSVLPVPDLPKVPGLPSVPSVDATAKYAFDVAEDLLKSQRDFTLQLANVLVPEKSA